MERTFVHVSLCRLRERPVVMEIAEPFAVFLVWKTGIRVFVYLLVHVMAVFLLRTVLAIPKIGDSTVCFVPTPFPGPVQDREPYLLQLRVPVPVLGLFEDEPCRFDGMARIDGPAGNRIDKFAVRPDRFEDGLKLRLHEITT